MQTDNKDFIGLITPAGVFHDRSSFLRGTNSVAFGHASVSVDPYNFFGGPVTGRIRSDGFTSVFDQTRRGFADASSSAEVRARGGRLMRNGTIRWGPILGTHVAGGTQVRGRDPIFFDVRDLVTGDEFDGSLLSIDANMDEGDFTWDSDAGTFALAATDFSFVIDMTSPFTSVNGTVDFRVVNGVVTQSLLSGIFAGLLPGVGSPGTFTVPFAPIEFDYDLGDFGGHDLDVELEFGGGVAAPEPASVVLLGTGAAALLLVVRRRRVRGA